MNAYICGSIKDYTLTGAPITLVGPPSMIVAPSDRLFQIVPNDRLRLLWSCAPFFLKVRAVKAALDFTTPERLKPPRFYLDLADSRGWVCDRWLARVCLHKTRGACNGEVVDISGGRSAEAILTCIPVARSETVPCMLHQNPLGNRSIRLRKGSTITRLYRTACRGPE